MHPKTTHSTLLILVTLLASSAQVGADELPSSARLGKKIANFTLSDPSGRPFTLHNLKDRRATVLVFLSFECPASTGYAEVLAKLADRYREQSVTFVGIAVADDATPAQLAKQAAEFKIPFAVLKDDKHAAADALKAEMTPEAFVLDHEFVLRYRGRIDDRYVARLKKKAAVGRDDLRQALDEVLAGKAVTEPVTRAIGCPLPWRRPAPAASGKVTFYRDVLPILQDRCQVCHRPGEVAPFSLLTYRQAVTWASDLKEYTQARKMPPWKATGDFPLHGERRMSDAEIATLAAWADGGTPAGEATEAPPPRRFSDGWHLGQPDLVLTVPDDFQLAATGVDLYRCFVLPTSLPEDKYVSAVEVRPGNRRVVHHGVLFYDVAGKARKLEAREKEIVKTAGRPEKGSGLVAGTAPPASLPACGRLASRLVLSTTSPDPFSGRTDSGPGYHVPLALSFLPGFLPEGGLSGWAPGLLPRRLAEGTGYLLPKGADVILQLHYHRTGRAEKDRTSVGLYFSKKPAGKRLRDVLVPGHLLYVPAGVERFKVEGTIWIREDCRIHTIMPHAHLLGREIKLAMVPENGPARTLVHVKDWDFEWQELYYPRNPIDVKAGTRFTIEGIFDNSAKNPRNPFNPPRAVFGGLETTNEMCVGFLGVTSDKPGPVRFDVQPRIPGLKSAPNWGIPGYGF